MDLRELLVQKREVVRTSGSSGHRPVSVIAVLFCFSYEARLSYNNFHMSVQHPVAFVIEVAINTVYSTLFIYYPLLEDVLFIAAYFGSVELFSVNVHMTLRKLLYLQCIRCVFSFGGGLINFLQHMIFSLI
jgi:hypothetical protein